MTAETARKELGHEVRVARAGEKITQSDLAQRCGWQSQSKIGKIESGQQATTVQDANTLAAALKLPEPLAARLRRLADDTRAKETEHPDVPKHFHEYLRLEPHADQILSWHTERVPGILQSATYMFTMFEDYKVSGKVHGRLRARQERQKILTSDTGTVFKVILSESSLCRKTSELDSVAREQLLHLVGIANDCDRVHLHAMPFSTPLRDVPQDFTIAEFPDSAPRRKIGFKKDLAHDSRIRDFVYLEDGTYIDKGEDKAKGKKKDDGKMWFDDWKKLWGELHAKSLSQHDTILLVEQVIRDRFSASS